MPHFLDQLKNYIWIHHFRLFGIPTIFTFQEVHVAVFFECDETIYVLSVVQNLIQSIATPMRIPRRVRDLVV